MNKQQQCDCNRQRKSYWIRGSEWKQEVCVLLLGGKSAVSFMLITENNELRGLLINTSNSLIITVFIKKFLCHLVTVSLFYFSHKCVTLSYIYYVYLVNLWFFHKFVTFGCKFVIFCCIFQTFSSYIWDFAVNLRLFSRKSGFLSCKYKTLISENLTFCIIIIINIVFPTVALHS